MSDIENPDLYDGVSADAPLIDSLGSAVKRLIDKGKLRGYITVEELNKALPPERESSEHIEDIMAGISDLGISIIAEADVDSFEPDMVEDDDVEIDEEDEAGNFDEKELGRNDDPVRMYLKEMGTVELLSREGEIAIAKRIEAGKTVMIDGLCESPMTIKAIAGWRDELLDGTMQLRDIVDLEMMYGDDVDDLAFEEDDAAANVDDFDKVAEELAKKKILTTLTMIWTMTSSWTARLTTSRMKTRTKPRMIWPEAMTTVIPLMAKTMIWTATETVPQPLSPPWKKPLKNLFWTF